MNTKTLIAATLATLVAGTAFAQSPAEAPKTRAQVIEEIKAARAAGELPIGDVYGYEIRARQSGPGKTREQVRAELAQAVANGELRSFSDLHGFDVAARPVASTVTRAEVRAEAVRALQAGELLRQRDWTGG